MCKASKSRDKHDCYQKHADKSGRVAVRAKRSSQKTKPAKFLAFERGYSLARTREEMYNVNTYMNMVKLECQKY